MMGNAKQLKEFAVANSFRTRMSAGGLDSYSNYSGEDLGDAVIVLGQSRDSDLMDRCNFASALAELGGESDTVQVHRMGHWACGWFEVIAVDPSDEKALATAYAIKKSLEDYPILDESSYYEMQSEERNEMFEYYASDFIDELKQALGLDELEDFVPCEDFIDLTRYLYEFDCSYRGDEDAWVSAERLPEALPAMRSHFYGVIEANPWYTYACVAMGLEQEAT